MNIKSLVFTIIETIIKVAVLAVVIVYVFRAATQAYDFGYRVFADEPVSISGGRTITVSVAEDASVKEIAEMLEEKGLIEDANLFVVQELLSVHHGKIVSGIYDLSTDMTAEQMLEILSPSVEEIEEEAGVQETPEATTLDQ
ncbi:MAG: endolytic transglycosylase MltG [Lachnospiraceae bacterium]|nr:endolytic transglycosylase MltG [Lachnospiraceae bacterium]